MQITKKGYSIEYDSSGELGRLTMILSLYGKKIEYGYDTICSAHFIWTIFPMNQFDFEGIKVTEPNIAFLQESALIKRLLKGEHYEHPETFERYLRHLGFLKEV